MNQQTMPNTITPSRRSLVTLIALLSFMSVEGRTHSAGRIAPRNYYYSRPRDPFDMVSEIFSMPIYVNSLARQHSNEVNRLARSWSPRYDVSEDAETGAVQLTMEVPGVSARDLDIELENDSLLRISGSRKIEQHGKAMESKFDHTFELDKNVDPHRLQVSLSRGILTVTAPKKEKVIQKIAIEVNENAQDLKLASAEPLTETEAASEEKGEHVDGLEIKEADE